MVHADNIIRPLRDRSREGMKYLSHMLEACSVSQSRIAVIYLLLMSITDSRDPVFIP